METETPPPNDENSTPAKEEVMNYETIVAEDVIETSSCQLQYTDDTNLIVSVNSAEEQSIFSCGLVIIEAYKDTPFWSQVKDQVNQVLQDYFRTTNTKFVAYKKSVNFLSNDIQIKKRRVSFEDIKVKGRDQQIVYDGTPYLVIGKNVFDCEFGVDRCVATKKKLLDIKALEALKRNSGTEESSENTKVVKRRKHAISKKFCCPCRIIIKDTIFFPTYKVQEKTAYQKRKASQTLFNDYEKGKDIPMVRKVFMKFPLLHEHRNHPLEGTKGRRRRRNRRKTKEGEVESSEVKQSPTEHDYIDPSLPNDMVGGIPTTTYRIWSKYMFDLVKRLNNFNPSGSTKEWRPFKVNGCQCGFVPLKVINELQDHPDVFTLVKDEKTENIKYVTIAETLRSADERSVAVQNVLQQIREKNVFASLNGWRDELYTVAVSFGGEILFEIERSAACLFGIHTYGVHVNGFVRNDDNQLSMWIGRRSANKPTWPGKLDNMVGGGLTSRVRIEDVLVKECLEEAMVPEELAKLAKPVGTVSYAYQNEEVISPETQFTYDLEVPSNFQPINLDGEVQEFYLVSMEEVKGLIATNEFKPNCALIVLDFLIRHGYIRPDEADANTLFFVTPDQSFSVDKITMNPTIKFIIFFLMFSELPFIFTAVYNMHVKTGRGLGAGTDASFALQIFGSDGHNFTSTLSGVGVKLERDSLDTFKLQGEYLSSIDHITIQRQQNSNILFDNWFICWIKIDNGHSIFYTIVNKWLNDDEIHTLQMSLGNCGNNAIRIQKCQSLE
eukprot:gene7038-7827_t